MRYLQPRLEEDLKEKFVLLAGPRQVGKTHLAKQVLTNTKGRYLNWDDAIDRQAILAQNFLGDSLVVLDEFHKYARWKNFLKGLYDKHHERLSVLMTGSARLDVFRRGGDSLFGRHYLHHLHPLSVGELVRGQGIPDPDEALAERTGAAPKELLNSLLRWGGFPEPFYKASETAHKRWSMQRSELLVRQDLRDLTQIELLSLVEHLVLLLPSRVGSVLSVPSLQEDLQVSFNTVRSWLDALERLYLLFSITPYSLNVQRSMRKAKKVYLWDWSQVPDEGARFENLVASHLLKAVQTWRDLGHGDFHLHFLRDRDRREVDFCIAKDRKPWLLVEAKKGEARISETLKYFCGRFEVPGVQLVHRPEVNRREGWIQVISADRWLGGLP